MRRKSSQTHVIAIKEGITTPSLETSGRQKSHAFAPEQEALLMKRIAGGDREAFSAVVEAYMHDVFRLSYSILRDRMGAEDIAQETFHRLWTKANQWNPSGRVRGWLLRIAHNLAIDEIRGKKDHYPEDVSSLPIRDDAPDALALYASRESGAIVNKALLQLPERQRTSLMLVYFQEHSNREAAEIMNISVDALESLLTRARQTMKELLKPAKPYLLES